MFYKGLSFINNSTKVVTQSVKQSLLTPEVYGTDPMPEVYGSDPMLEVYSSDPMPEAYGSDPNIVAVCWIS